MNTNKAGGLFGHPIIPDTHVHLRRMICAKQKDLNEIGKLIFPISTFVDPEFDQSHIIGEAQKGLLFFIHTIHSIHPIDTNSSDTFITGPRLFAKFHVFCTFPYSLVILVVSSQRMNTKTGI